MAMYGAPNVYPSSPIMAPSSPLMMSQQQPQPFSPNNGQPIQAGQITYTSTTTPEGRIIYHPFKAVPASYQTPNGVVTGIQWIPAEATSVVPQGAVPANAEFEASWRGGSHSRQSDKAQREWQKDEERRRRKEEKEAAKRVAQWDKERRTDREDREYRRAMDSRAGHRLSGNYSAVPAVAGSTGSGGYSNPYSTGELESRLDNFDGLGRRDYQRERRNSGYGRNRQSGSYGVDDRGEPYSAVPYSASAGPYTSAGYPAGQRPASPYSMPGNFGPPSPRAASAPLGYPSSPSRVATDIYQRSASPYHGPSTIPSVYNDGGQRSRAPSPMPIPGGIGGGMGGGMGGGGFSRSRAASPIPGAVPYARSRAASPNPGYIPRSRAASPVPGYGAGGYGSGMPQATIPGRGPSPRPSPRMGGNAALMSSYPQDTQQPLRPPEGFNRPPNLAQAYTWFDIMKIQDMDDFFDTMPRMPLVLVPHDVYHEDWIRFMQDLGLAWAGKLPTADPGRAGHNPRRSRMTSELIDLWNTSFFIQRGVEVVLFKGRERRSGTHAGIVEARLPGFDSDDEDSSSESSSESDSDLSDDRYGRGVASPYGPYGRQPDPYSSEVRDAKRRRRERKQEKKRRHKEKKAKKKALEREKKYALYITCVPLRDGGAVY